VEIELKSSWCIELLTRLRSAIGIVLASAFTLVISSLVVIFGTLRLHSWATLLMWLWGRGVLLIFNIRIDVIGEENLPKRGGGIVVFNHQSHFDIPALSAASLKRIRYGAKIELFKIPIFGTAIRASGCLPIARQNRNEVLRVYREAEVKFKEHFLFCLAPEGTRQDSPTIGRFKKGPFLFALNGRVPIIPAVITGAYEVLPKKSLLINIGQMQRTIRVEFLKPLPVDNLVPANVEQLLDATRVKMCESFERQSRSS
jgi:1-acyl-sn-glycerol-3-phosphate acyltransferase